MPVPASYRSPVSDYVSYEDTLFFTPDSGHHWRVVGTFGTHPPKFSYVARPIKDLLETETRVALIDDSNRLYTTADTFKTIDTEHLPEVAQSLSSIADMLYLWSVHGNRFRSTDFGKHWREVFDLNDTGSNWYGGIIQRGDSEVLYVFQQSPVYPWGDTNLHLFCSFNGEVNWSGGTTPVNNKFPYFFWAR